jgi:hypothetical protein
MDGGNTGGQIVTSGYVPIDGTWHYMTAEKLIRSGSTQIRCMVAQSNPDQRAGIVGLDIDVDDLMVSIGRTPFSYQEHSVDYLLYPSSIVLGPIDVMAWSDANTHNATCTMTAPIIANPINDAGHIVYPLSQIPYQIDGRTTVISSIIIYYSNTSTSDYIQRSTVYYNNVDGSYVAALDYTTDYGKTATGEQWQEIVSTPFEHPGKPMVLDFHTAGTAANIGIRTIRIIYYTEVVTT